MHSKLKEVARPTTSSLVRDLFKHWGIAAPAEALREVAGRNLVAHTGLMNEDGSYSMERDVRRVRMIRTLLAGMLLRNAGYEGALAGWDRDERGWLSRADWYHPSERATEAAGQIFAARAEPSS